MSRSKKTQAQLQEELPIRFAYVGDRKVEGELQVIEFMCSTLETIDGAMMDFLGKDLDLFVTTNDGFKRVPPLWVTAERAYQIKNNKDLRDDEGTLVLPLITLTRTNVTKEPGFKGTVYANLYPYPDAKGGTITVARQINQKKTAEFQNAAANQRYGPHNAVRSKMYNSSKRDMSTQRVVYETITVPLPTWVKVHYQVSLRTEYQQQMNELLQPFVTVPGNSRMPHRIHKEGHYYEVFVDGGFANNANQAALGMSERNYETNIDIEVLGYLMGEGENQERPRIVKRENAVEFKFSREHTMLGDIPTTVRDAFYRE
jgi:hypothetical protein